MTRDMNVTVSAPGKVLIAGGFIVLERDYKGIVITVSSRFYVNVGCLFEQPIRDYDVSEGIPIVIDSPQFRSCRHCLLKWNDKEFRFFLESASDDTVASSNSFVDDTLVYSLNVISTIEASQGHDVLLRSTLSRGLIIRILGDNDFYSQKDQLMERNLPTNSESLSKLPKCCAFYSTSLNQIRKTGLGSSAALTSALVGSLLEYFGLVKLASDSNQRSLSSIHESDSLNLIHHLAQVCHCLAQKKIGSGFDVAAAIYGSQVYRRVSPSILSSLIEENHHEISRITSNRFSILTSFDWDYEFDSIHLPKGTHLVLGDVHRSTNSPTMASAILRWKQSYPIEASNLWKTMGHLVDNLVTSLRLTQQFYELHEADYLIVIDQLSQSHTRDWGYLPWSNELQSQLVNVFLDIHKLFRDLRSSMRDMGQQANVPIEPPEQTKLLDTTLELPGILCAGIPGAGGYDAIFCITIGHRSRMVLSDFWSHLYPDGYVCALVAEEASQGLRLETFPEMS